jgi:Ca-activated chloride channel family protein
MEGIMMKKRISIVLVLMMIAGSLFGCGKASKDAGEGDTLYETQSQYDISSEAKVENDSMNSVFTVDQPMVESETSISDVANGYAADVEFNTEEYNTIIENNFKSVSNYPVSTFSADVDTASYSNVRRMIQEGSYIDPGAVRIEEMINYFSYDYAAPEGEHPFAVTTELADCPWNQDTKLLLVGIQTDKVDFSDSPASNLVFLIDVSGSMYDENKLPLVQKAFAMLTENLTQKDKISIVVYAGDDAVILDGANGMEKERIIAAIDQLEAGGSTAGSEGIETAYALAEKNFIRGGNNRVILATDGDLNVGITSESELSELISEKKESGVYLSVLGFGMGNYKDNKMEALADKGNGNYAYIDSLLEAKKVLVEEMGATLFTVAKDVKLQVEFNPNTVKGYRLVGYENRLLATEDFNDDTKDAGEIGAGHSVTALYEIALSNSELNIPSTELKYQDQSANMEDGELLTVSIRYKKPAESTSILMEEVVRADQYMETLPKNLRFAAAVAEFGMILRNSEFKGSSTYEGILALLCLEDFSQDSYRQEFVELVQDVGDTILYVE